MSSVPYLISRAVVSALEADTQLDGALVIDNPETATAMDKGSRVVFVEDKDDFPRDQPGQTEGRTFAFIVGVINRSAGARLGADNDMERVKAVATKGARDACLALQRAKVIGIFEYPREMQRAYRIEGIDVGGALITTRFEIDYRLPATRPAVT